MNGAGNDGLTVAGRELTFRCIVAYKRSLANSSHATMQPKATIPAFIKLNQQAKTFYLQFFNKGGHRKQQKQQFPK